MKFIFTLLIFVSVPVWADSNLIETLSNEAKKVERLSGVFIQNRKIEVLPLPLISEGEFSYHYQTGMIWNTLKPVQTKVYITNQGIQTEDNGSVSQTVGSAQLAQTLLGLFSGNLTSLTEQFNIEANGDITEWHLHLVPKNELVAAQIIFIDIRGRETTESVAIADANGDRSDLTFTTHKLILFEK